MKDQINEEKIKKAALDVLTLARNTLMVNLRFMDLALARLQLIPDESGTLATNGDQLSYDPRHVLRCFKKEHDSLTRDYLHAVLHCIFSHMFVGETINVELWDMACDIAVENTINDLGIRVTNTSRQTAQKDMLAILKKELSMLTAEKLYHYFRDKRLSESEISKIAALFKADDHSCWYTSRPNGIGGAGGDRDTKDRDSAEADDEDQGPGKNEADDEGQADEESPDDIGEGVNSGWNKDLQTDEKAGEASASDSGTQEELMEEWKEIAEKIQEDLETFSREHGNSAGGMIQNLSEVNREKYDYETFLKKFSVLGEAMVINDEEFDYIFYTYGLKLYENMPLIEPLEYKEVKRIREFVIAIDTSGSTSGTLVQKFIQKTYNILKSTQSYFSHINIHIIQCDAEIQEHVKITSEEEYEEYMKTMKIYGLGGTDFRPVFDFVDRLIDEGEFTNLKGLIYFTDGYGTFPARKPSYDTAFVFLDNEYNNPNVPPWAIKLVLQDEDI
ncbi:MAG: metallopeptidase [Mogibacterium sp.]|nr:metallopeptidase [Mogibacterium sp.]